MRIPSRQECYRIICRMEMMEHIVAHSIQVCRVAVFLAEHLNIQVNAQSNARAVTLNCDLIQASALLHDITKTRSFQTRENHAETGAQLISTLGYPEVGSIIGQHVRLNAYCFSDPVKEAEIVNYADKRVVHDRVVTLGDRMEYIMDRYAKTEADKERIRGFWKQLARLEDKIFIRLSFSPRDLNNSFGPDGYIHERSEFRSISRKIPLSAR